MLRHHETIHTGYFHRNGYLMLHYLAAATIQVANLVNYDCHPLEDVNNLRNDSRHRHHMCVFECLINLFSTSGTDENF